MVKALGFIGAALGGLTLAACATPSAGPAQDAGAIRSSLIAAREAEPLLEAEVRNRDVFSGCDPTGNRSDLLGRQWEAFNLGALDARECAVRAIESVSDASALDPAYAAVRRDVMRLHGFYNRRAQRQQAFMDFGSGISALGTAGAFQGGISNASQQAWAITAFTPVVISQFNAYEPTRELFHGGALALQLITLRYDRYNRALTLLGEAAATVDCAPHQRALATIVSWRQPRATRAYDPDGVMQAEAQRLTTQCLDLQSRADALGFAVGYARQRRAYLAAEYAADVLQLDHAIVGKDRDLRYSPSETLSALVASPLRAADTLLTGQNTKAAIDNLRTQIAFSGLNRNLATIALPPLPASAPPVAPLSGVAAALDRQGAPAPVTAQIAVLRGLAQGLQARHTRQSFELGLAAEFAEAAAADHLTFSYDAATTTTTVRVGRRAEPTTLASGDTAAGMASGQ